VAGALQGQRRVLNEVMVSEEIKGFAKRVAARLPEQVESIIYYPHPFTHGGIVIVFNDSIGFLPDYVSEIYRCLPLPHLSIHYLRSSELFQLALPGLFTMPAAINEQPHLALSLKHKGTVLYGRDLREEVPVPTNPAAVLNNHIEGCRVHLPLHGWLRWLGNREYLALLEELDRQVRYLLATALLLHNQWDVEMENLPEQFGHYFADHPARQVCDQFFALRERVEAADEDSLRARAFEAVWLFESLLRELEAHAR
jgi:hypothetical protein